MRGAAKTVPDSSGPITVLWASVHECPRTASAVSEVRPYASCVELEVRPASEVERFVAFARANGCQCRVTFRDNALTFDVPLARDPTEARRIALDVIARFSADNRRADVRVTRYD